MTSYAMYICAAWAFAAVVLLAVSLQTFLAWRRARK